MEPFSSGSGKTEDFISGAELFCSGFRCSVSENGGLPEGEGFRLDCCGIGIIGRATSAIGSVTGSGTRL